MSNAPPVVPYENSKVINETFRASGVIDEEVIKKASEEGYKSVLNVRGENEPGFFDEKELVEKYGLKYGHSHVNASPQHLDYKSVLKAVEVLDLLPKPVFIHCSGGTRAALTALAYESVKNKKMTAEEIIEEGSKVGCNFNPVWQEEIKKEHK